MEKYDRNYIISQTRNVYHDNKASQKAFKNVVWPHIWKWFGFTPKLIIRENDDEDKHKGLDAITECEMVGTYTIAFRVEKDGGHGAYPHNNFTIRYERPISKAKTEDEKHLILDYADVAIQAFTTKNYGNLICAGAMRVEWLVYFEQHYGIPFALRKNPIDGNLFKASPHFYKIRNWFKNHFKLDDSSEIIMIYPDILIGHSWLTGVDRETFK